MIDELNVFNDAVLSSILLNLAEVEDVNEFIEEVYVEIITSFASCDEVNEFTDAVAAANWSTLLTSEPAPPLPTDADNAEIDEDTFVILSANTLPLY